MPSISQIAVPYLPPLVMGHTTVDSCCPEYANAYERWRLIACLLGGTQTMRKCGTEWLPQEPGETEDKYNIRLNRSILFNGFKNAIESLASRPFSRPITFSADLPSALAGLRTNVNLEGQKLESWSRAVYKDALTWGLTHVLVDYPPLPANANMSLAEERNSGRRAYFVHVPATSLFYWRSERDPVTNVRVPSEIRFFESVNIEEGEYGHVCKLRIRRYTKTHWYTYEMAASGGSTGAISANWKVVGQGEHTFGRVPLHTFYTAYSGFMVAEPPFEDLAWLNLAHWQSYSDQRNILRVVRVAILFAKGFPPESEMSKSGKLTIGPNMVVTSDAPEADLRYVEHSGAGIKAGAEDLRDLEERMVQLGLRPFIERTQVRTATSASINDTNSTTDSQAWTEGFSIFLTELFGMAAEWHKIDLPEKFKANVYRDYSSPVANEDMRLLIELRKDRGLTRNTLLRELVRRGKLADDFDIDKEIEQLDSEDVPMTSLPGQPGYDPRVPTAKPTPLPTSPDVDKPLAM